LEVEEGVGGWEFLLEVEEVGGQEYFGEEVWIKGGIEEEECGQDYYVEEEGSGREVS
jgi:hypothetical protein